MKKIGDGMLKCVASDVDGTLMRYGEQKVSDRLIAQIRELKAYGVRFIVASGRPYTNLRRVFRDVADDISYIVENGSMCFDNGEIIYKDPLPQSLVMEIIRDVISTQECEILLSTPRINILQPKTQGFVNHIRDVLQFDFELTEDVLAVQEEIIKISVCKFEGICVWEDFLKKKYQDRAMVVTSGNIWLDFISKNVNKGVALQKLLDRFFIDREETIAFGDQFNDREMLELAGCGYAVKNAAPGVKKIADKTCGRVEDVLEEELKILRKQAQNSLLCHQKDETRENNTSK